MATSIEKISMDLKAESSSGKCLVETEFTKPDLDGPTFRKSKGRKKRILYDREFLIKCFHSPASARKPSGFPIPHLDCTLGASKIKRLPLTAPQQQAYLPPKRKEEGAKRERDGEDNISLRPHSGNFSGGCGPNLTSPSHVPTSTSFARIHAHEEPPKSYDRDRDFHRNNFRYGGGGGHNRRDMNDRNRMDRDRDREMDGRDHRDRMNRDRLSGSNHRSSNSWSNDGQESDWSRRRNGAHFPRDRDYNNSNKRYDRRDDEQEPEWFSGGPSDRHETIELRGFLDDDRRDKSDDLQNGYEKETLQHNGEIDSGGESTKNDQSGESESLSIEKILKMDHIPGILPNDMLESEEPSGSSRFSQFFKRNSATPDPGMGRAAHFDQHENNSNSNHEDKSKAVHEMGELLRNMLIKKNVPAEPSPEPKPKEAAKPAPATKDDVDAFKKLVTPLLEKVLMGPSTKKASTGKPSGGEHGQGNHGGGNVMDLFKSPPQQQNQQKSQSTPVPEENTPRNNPLQDIFNSMMSKQQAPVQPQPDEIIRLSPNQAMLMLPPELQQLVLNVNVSQNDYIMLVNLAKNNEWTFRGVLNGVLSNSLPPQQHLAYVGVFKLLIIGAINLPGVVVINPNSQTMHPMPQPMPNHRPPNFEKIMQRPSEDGPKEMAKRSATPVSSMAFTPTSVMRKMTADGGKSVPPSNPTGFVPVPISGGLLPTPPTTAPVIMNSNNQNLASLMSSMARPHSHLQFRPNPPPMGFPPNAGFHPSMMTQHGPVMIPNPFQNILPNQQPIYNKSEEN